MIVTLLTDFGSTDHFVAAMKGVILSRDPRILIVDVTHEVPAHDTPSAAFLLNSVYRDFPRGTVHVVVVDPGVGSSRRPIALRSDGYFFVGPDNGIFDLVRTRQAAEVRVIADPALMRAEVSRTFHGRDIFAPTAAALALGFPFDQVGPTADLGAPSIPEVEVGADGCRNGRILHVDRFGNGVTSLTVGDLPGGPAAYRFSGTEWSVDQVRDFYGSGAGIEPFVIEGSSGYLEISVNRASAADRLGLRRGEPVVAIPRLAEEARQAGSVSVP